MTDEAAHLSERDWVLLRRSCELARAARDEGNHPFGCLLADGDGTILLESRNQAHSGPATHVDRTAHAELLLARAAAARYTADELQNCTLYTGFEPCCMCAGATYWAGIGRVVFGITEHHLRAITGSHEENPTLDLPCREVFARGQRSIEVIGPVDLPEALAAHAGYWK